METPLRISFQGSDASEALRQMITEHVDTLEQLHGRLTACHVVIKVPDKHHRTSGLFSANIHMTLPGGIDINVDHTPQDDDRFSSPQFAVNDAFRRAKRLIKERVHKQRGEVKTLRERIERTIDQPPDA
ncbi:HPF/RaiA family ribosome-associated protein [Reyranella sp.]|uniref:HPF/RaiA family ribosome-associated protein n=1 Tax=Reyranella sp. TaxID=1929291 RepID=UPI002730E7AD|nr:HPF/RaiA family ribosome-associated protein [Reyranella sp.]MDP2373368.1 HPF/RaiA family ribosome-associated protein [Reyranella sp.]